MAEPSTDLTLYSASLLASEEHEVAIVGRSPWYLAWRRLRRNYAALFSLFVFILIVVACALAPVYAKHVAHTGPNETHVAGTVKVGDEQKPIISGGATYNPKTGRLDVKAVKILGPTWFAGHGRYFLGADALGRDVAVRLLYGGLNSLKIVIGSALICTLCAVVLALLGGYYGGWFDWFVTRFFDVIWAFPVLLLAIALGSALSINGFHHFGISIEPVIEAEWVSQHKIEIAERIDRRRCRGHGEQTRRLGAAAVEVLPPGIERRREQAAFAPLEADLLVFIVPDRGGAVALDDVDHLLKQHPLRMQALAGRDLAQIGVVDVAGADQIEVGAAAGRKRVVVADPRNVRIRQFSLLNQSLPLQRMCVPYSNPVTRAND